MNILFICESFPTTISADFTGGVEARDYYTAHALSQKHQVTVLTGARYHVPNKQTLNRIQIIRCGFPVSATRRETLIARITFIVHALIISPSLTFDIIQASNVVSQSLASLLKLIHRKPAISLVADVFINKWFQNTSPLTAVIGEVIERYTVKFPWNHYIAVSQTTAQKLIKNGVDPTKISVIHAGFESRLLTGNTPLRYHRPTIVYAGRLVGYKRVADLIRATSILKHRHPNIRLLIIGMGPLKHQLHQLVASLNLQHTVIFKGFIPSHKRVINIIRRAHLFCNPSIVEGFGLTTIEAMAAGTPVIIADTPVSHEVTNHQKGSLFFTPQNYHHLAQQISKLLTNRQLWRRKSLQAQSHARLFSWHQVAQLSIQVYSQCLATKPRHRLSICLITEFFPSKDNIQFSGGVEARTYFIYKYLSAVHDLHVISRPKIHVDASSTSIIPRLKFLLTAIYQALNTPADIIEGSNVTCYLPAFIAAKLKRKPAIAWIPDVYLSIWFSNFSLLPACTGYILERVALWLPWDHIIAMSQSTKHKLVSSGVNPQKITVVYGGVEVDRLKQLPSTKYSRPTIITLARLVKYKRIQDLIKACSLLKHQFPDIRLFILGDGPYVSRLQSLVESRRLSKHVFFLGNVAHTQAMKMLKKSHIFSLPSIVEGFGLVTIEALAAGVPFVNSDIAPTREITHNGIGGYLYPPQQYSQLAHLISHLLTRESTYRQKVKQGLSFVIRYDWQIIAKQTEQVYKKVLT